MKNEKSVSDQLNKPGYAWL